MTQNLIRFLLVAGIACLAGCGEDDRYKEAARMIGMVLVTVVVVGFCWTLLWGLRNDNASDAELAELLIHDMARDEPLLRIAALSAPAIANRRTNARSNQPALSHESDRAEETNQQGENH